MMMQNVVFVINRVLLTLALATAYLIAGKAGLMLAIPPGYATAIFPASGVALVAFLLWGTRLWPGIFLGSLFLNIWVTLNAGQPLNLHSVGIAAGIGSGAVLQALFGVWLIRRFIGLPLTLSREIEVIRFLFLGGVSCLVGASVGVTMLWVGGAVSTESILFSWWTWWVGDALGVLLGVPILFTFLGRPVSLWRTRRWSVAIPMGMVALGIVPLFIGVSHWESQRVVSEFRKQAALLQQTFESKLQLNLDALHALRDYSKGVDELNFKGFSIFTEGTLARHSSLNAISFNPRITAGEREAFESSIRLQVDPEFYIKERWSEGGLKVAESRPEHVVVAYIQPLGSNRNALGFDVASNLVRKIALDQARDMGSAVATGSINLVQEKQTQKGVLIFLPTYREGVPSTLTERREQLLGYFVGVYRMGDLLASALVGVDQRNISVRLYDQGESGQSLFLAGFGGGQGVWEEEAKLEHGLGVEGPWWSDTLEFAERHWRIEFSPTHTALGEQRSWGGWFVLAGGLLFASLLGAFLLIMTGRTARIEELVEERTRELADRELRLAVILQSAGDGIVTIDAHGMIESANPAANHLLGYDTDDLSGRSIYLVMPALLEHRQKNFFKLCAESGEESGSNVSHWEIEGLCKDGLTIPLELSVTEVKLAGQMLFTCILHDLTKHKQADKLKNEFVSTVSHELRTPLTSIHGGLKMVLAGLAGKISADKVQGMVELAYRNSERLNLLINDILDIQKIESGGIEFQFEPLDAATLVRRTLEDNRGYAEKFGISYRLIDPVPEGVLTRGDEPRLCQVLANLLSNAAKFSQTGDVVEVRLQQQEAWILFSVTDHGPGIPPEFQSRVFQKFAQADSSDTRQKGGTGLGLSITKALVEGLHGEIGFETQPGVGTTFYFRLPAIGEAEFKDIK